MHCLSPHSALSVSDTVVAAASVSEVNKLHKFVAIHESHVLCVNNRVAHCPRRSCACAAARQWSRTNLVDPASSHMLVSKIKPCMSQYKLLYGETANGLLKQL